ncbi:hypothetical protein [Thalassobellus suaedae]|uniref:Lipoprotein n=1 Tax=Thalassobellus suaedae TaxID=3074124 RepID=A0ABY9XQB0_9FLAO|nr:hypothetical protein RHP51_13065 [Flavobacteriaceae bacterium HL-DH14]
MPHNNSTYNNLNTIILLLIVLLGISCGTKKSIAQEDVKQEITPKLLFLNYIISKDANNKKSIQFINKTIADGKAKSNSNKYIKTSTVGDLKCSQLDKDSIEINHVFIKNPFIKTIEFVNDSLSFESKRVVLNKAPISLRLQLHSKTKLVVISEIIDTLQNSKPLITTKLNEL